MPPRHKLIMTKNDPMLALYQGITVIIIYYISKQFFYALFTDEETHSGPPENRRGRKDRAERMKERFLRIFY